jgi:glycerol uptake facilitator-like aquaporin
VFATIDIPVVGGGALGVFPIAMSVMVAHLFLLPIDGCSINPSRSFGPSLIAAIAGIEGEYYHQQYMYVLAVRCVPALIFHLILSKCCYTNPDTMCSTALLLH